MKKTAGSKNTMLRFSNAGFFLLAAAVPLIITKITFSQSDLPKNTALIVSGSIAVSFSFLLFLLNNFRKEAKNIPLELKFIPLIDIPVLIYFSGIVISFIFSLNRYVSYYGEYERHIGLITYIFLLLIYISAAIINRSKSFTAGLILTMEITAVTAAFYALLQQAGTDPFDIQPADIHRPVSTIGNAVFTGGFLAMILPLSILNISDKKNIFIKYLFPLIILSGIIVTRTRSAYLAVIAEIFVFTVIYVMLRRFKGNKKFIFIAGSFLAFIILISFIFPSNIFTVRLFSILDSGYNQRWLIWADAFNVFYKYPLTGTGIGNFPTAFAEFYSYKLRYDDVMRFVDNAHNNYLQILFTTGITGLAGFISILAGYVFLCIKSIKKLSKEMSNEYLFFSALLCSITGYMIYSITNFDDISMLLYFTLLLVLLREGTDGKILRIMIKSRYRISAYIITASIFVYLVFSSYTSINRFVADAGFLKGKQLAANRKFKEGVNKLNEAVLMWEQNPVYHYTLASEVYTYVKSNAKLDEKIRNGLLIQAADELLKAKINHSNINACDALLTLVLFENGKTAEAEELKKKVLKADEVNIFFRMNLAYYYTNSGNKASAKEQVDELNRTGFKSKELYFVEALYYLSVSDKQEAIKLCDKILEADPANRDAIEIKRRAMLLN